MKPIALVFSLTLLVLGCSSNSIVSADGVDPQLGHISYDQFHKDVDGKVLTAVFRNGQECRAIGVRLRKDTTSFTNDDTGQILSVSTQDILRFEHRNHLSGALGGLMLGASGGFLIGYGLAAGSHDAGVGSAWFYGAAFGGGCGLYFGGLFGQLHEYELPNVSADDSVHHKGAP